jgi:hydrogenase maturation factor
VIFTAFGDMMRVPGTRGSPLEYKARGADVRIVYSPADALKLAQANPDRHVMFFAIGFETTAPSTALTLMRARALGNPELLRILQSRDHHSGHSRHPGFAGYAPGRFHRAGPRIHGHRLPAL